MASDIVAHLVGIGASILTMGGYRLFEYRLRPTLAPERVLMSGEVVPSDGVAS